MTKSDFVDWKRHQVTQQVMSILHSRIEATKDEMVGAARNGDSIDIAFKAGLILSMQEIVNINYEDTHGN